MGHGGLQPGGIFALHNLQRQVNQFTVVGSEGDTLGRPDAVTVDMTDIALYVADTGLMDYLCKEPFNMFCRLIGPRLSLALNRHNSRSSQEIISQRRVP